MKFGICKYQTKIKLLVSKFDSYSLTLNNILLMGHTGFDGVMNTDMDNTLGDER